MADNDLQLDQLWFTWSTSGLGSMSMGYRVRAASPGLYDVQGMRYRRVTRFLSYELPQGVSVSDFNSRIAPVSLSFIHNGDENLLIRKVFTGHDAVGRNGAFFTHLIAGLPREFTAREAIRLWYCPQLWVESEQGKPSNDTALPTIPYSAIQAAVQHSQTSFSFVQISEPLKNLLLLILSQGVPEHIYATGPSVFTAALIYGLTHCLPITLLKDFSFTTYESNVNETEITLVGTISGADLFDMTGLKVQPSAPGGQISADIVNYVKTSLHSLLNGTNTQKLKNVITGAESYDYNTTNALIQLFKQRFHFGPLTVEQVKNIISFPNDNRDDLLDPGIQQESATLLLNNLGYWQKEGKSIFSVAAKWLEPDANTVLMPQDREALATFLSNVSAYVLAAMKTDIVQERMPAHPGDILLTLALPATNTTLYQQMVTDFAQGAVYQKAISDSFWPFQLWLLRRAKEMQPQPAPQQMLPWLQIRAWEKLDQVLKLDLPGEWEQLAMSELLTRPLAKIAVTVVQTHEPKFTTLLQRLLQQGNQLPKPEYTSSVIRFFAALVEHDYPNRVPLLLSLLNTSPKDLMVVEKLVSLVRFATPHQLTATEIEKVLTECRSEVLAACGSSPSLTEYIREYIFYLTPGKLSHEKVQKLLAQLGTATSLPDFLDNPLSHWAAIAEFTHQHTINRQSLKKVRTALQHLFPAGQAGGSPHATSFDQSHEIHRKTVVAEILSILVVQVQSEYDLETVLELLESQLAPTSWELLCRLGEQAGKMYNQPQSIYRLTPYLLCGINNFPRSHYAPETLDAYLFALYGKVNNDALKGIDTTAESSVVWPELIHREWKGWRDRTKPDWRANIPVINKYVVQQPKPPTGPHPAQPPAPIGYAGSPAPVSDYRQVQPLPEQHAFPLTQPQPAPVQAQQIQTQKTQPATWQGNGNVQPNNVDAQTSSALPIQIKANVYDHRCIWTENEYSALQKVLIRMLSYWVGVLNDHLQKQQSKSVTFEANTISALKDELNKLSPQIASPKLIEYLTDNELLQLEIEKMRRDNKPVQFLLPGSYLETRRNDFQRFLGDFTYQSFTEKSMNEALILLIRRFHFIQHRDEPKKDWWKKWIEKERKHVTIEIPKQVK